MEWTTVFRPGSERTPEMSKPSQRATSRCAIYTRVSSDQGLEQDFNSLDAQREACSAYIKSQASEGWKALFKTYDDGGYSGGSLERPALLQLLDDIRARKIDIVVVYKVDRLTRALADFAKLVELFDGHGVSFVSVTQSFNTTTSMGRLTLNVLLSFAQFEREVTGERIRDKIAASKKKGLWVGGVVPLGYRVENKRLIVDDREAAIVKLIFARYLELGSLPSLQKDLRDKSVCTRVRTLSSGRVVGGGHLTNGPLNHLLRNRVYLGEINHQGQSYKGEHQPIIDSALFDAVQARLSNNLLIRREDRLTSDALLTGKLFDDRNNRMSPTYAIKKGLRYRYYVSTALVQGQKEQAGSVPRLPANELEKTVLAALKDKVSSEGREEDRDLIERYLSQVVVRTGIVDVAIIMSDREAASAVETISIPWAPQPSTRKRDLLVPQGSDAAALRPMKIENRTRLLKAIRKALGWLDELINHKVADTEALAKREGCSERAVRLTLSLAFLAPDIVTAAIEGRLPRGLGLTRLTELPSDWTEQRRLLGIA
jgi:site-specific DNA recombinase